MGTGKQYDEEFKKQAIKLAKEIGTKAAADELCIPKGTLGTWVQKARIGEIDTGAGSRTPGESLTIAQQLQAANKRIKELEKKNRELEELNFWRKHLLFSPRTVGSQERRTVKVHFQKD